MTTPLHETGLLGLSTVAAAIAGAMLAQAWRKAARAPFLAAWVGCCVAMPLAMALGAAGAPLVAQAMTLTALACLWAGARLVRRARVPGWAVALPGLAWLLAHQVPGFGAVAITAQLTATTLLVALAMAELGRVRQPGSIGGASQGLAAALGLFLLLHLTPGQPEAAAWAGLAMALGFAGLALANGQVAAREADHLAQTAEREAAALRAGRDEVLRLHQGLPAVVFLRDVAADGSSHVLYKGGDIAAVTGWSAQALASGGGLEALAGPGSAPFAISLKRVLQEGQDSFDWRIAQPDGSWRWMRSQLRRLSLRPDGGGEVVGYVLDVTAQRTAESQAMASARLAALGEVSAGLAHELRQPLTAILLATEHARMVLERGDAANADARMALVLEQAERAGELIDHLRRFARGSDRSEALEPVPVRQAVEGALSLANTELRDSQVKLELALGEPGLSVLGQRLPLEQVLMNILLNARDAMLDRPRETPRVVRISASTQPGEALVRIVIADTGGGIPPAVLARLFQPFVSTKGPERGTGLGLSICQNLIRGMNGRIEASNDSAGAVFTLSLPAASLPSVMAEVNPNSLLAEGSAAARVAA